MTGEDQELRRWRRAIRRQVRMLVAEHGGLPAALLLWTSDRAGKPGAVFTPGQDATDGGMVRVRVREIVEGSFARMAAIGRPLTWEGSMHFFLVVASEGVVEQWVAPLEDVVAQEDGGVLFSGLGGWVRAHDHDGGTGELLQAGLRRVARERGWVGDAVVEAAKARLAQRYGVVIPG